AAHERRVEHAREHHVVGVGALPGQEALVLDPVDPCPRVARRTRGLDVGHRSLSGRVASRRQASFAAQPPSTGTIAPGTNDARSDTRNAATSATSDGLPARPSAAFSNISGYFSPPDAPMISVRMKPGQIALTRMPCLPYSTAASLVTA